MAYEVQCTRGVPFDRACFLNVSYWDKVSFHAAVFVTGPQPKLLQLWGNRQNMISSWPYLIHVSFPSINLVIDSLNCKTLSDFLFKIKLVFFESVLAYFFIIDIDIVMNTIYGKYKFIW